MMCYNNSVIADEINKPNRYLWSLQDHCNDVLIGCFEVNVKLKCSKCQEMLHTHRFHKNKRFSRGFSNQCKECRDPSKKQRESKDKWVVNNKDKVYLSQKLYKENNAEKTKAHNKVYRSVASGLLKKEGCRVCGSEKVQAHHEDYSKPLDIWWLCPQHHSDRHAELREIGEDNG